MHQRSSSITGRNLIIFTFAHLITSARLRQYSAHQWSPTPQARSADRGGFSWNTNVQKHYLLPSLDRSAKRLGTTAVHERKQLLLPAVSKQIKLERASLYTASVLLQSEQIPTIYPDRIIKTGNRLF